MNTIYCDFSKCKTELKSIYGILTIEDTHLFHRTLHFCNWRCLTKFMEEKKFSIKKEKLFSVMI